MNIRNVAIIAHVDHGKTTLVDGLLKQSQTFRTNEAAMTQDLIMDSNDQERERGITILAKNTAINYKGVKINIIDTPGHADFGGEVERTLSMADGAILLIDAQEGPMPQTKFVLKKAFGLGLKIMVVINKIDKINADIPKTIDKTYDLFLELATDDAQLDFPVYYAIGRSGKAWDELPPKGAPSGPEDENLEANLTPILDGIITHIPEPVKNDEAPLQMLVSALEYDTFIGKHAIGKIKGGIAKAGMPAVLVNESGVAESGRIEKIFVNLGLKKVEVSEAASGDIVSIAGLKKVSIGDTIADPSNPAALPAIAIEEPTLNISIYANTSPFAGREGKYVTARHLHDRIVKELETNVSMRLATDENGPKGAPVGGEFILSGRGELHLSVFIETLRREGYELQAGKPKIITKEIDGVVSEPVEELTVDVATDSASAVIGEINKRRGILMHQEENSDGSTRLVFEITTRGMLGLRNILLTISKGTAVMNSIFLRWDKIGGAIPKLRNGVLIAFLAGKAVSYGLNIAQLRGTTFIPPNTDVYAGMIVGLNQREDDLEINICKEKQLTNMRASSADQITVLTPPTILSLEQCIDFLEDDELLEVTPSNLRLRKKILDSNLRIKARKPKATA
ncbi:translational GTPase TypA [Candidatus Berkelbacteria bacterium CG10_big_fil_rev_8_21_14_0_10_43_13]|uniref:50S ribosomal subunit assembly factor BipA n=1 Tax=Candidatus Berkelbacteria bacterium CG10_big_fil_rev_8_21_14_0_10_43_13 TaxID=1974514 RepID=A0A2H0W918_9BACT|nr:MAG: translational GTPase TypA [Candidatus Berkelbacteria bacterium CG10_big_fil_rev_8_21_14_0_10_43_13]